MADSQPSQSSQPQPSNGSQEQPVPAPDTADSTIKPDPDIDASVEQDIDMNAEQNASAANPDENAGDALATEVDQLAAAPAPTKKETSLREFLGKMDDYAPIVRIPGLYFLFPSRSPCPSRPSRLPSINADATR